MVNALLAHWSDPPEVHITPLDIYPLAEATGIPEAFQGWELNWDILRKHFGPELIYINFDTPLEWREVGLSLSKTNFEQVIGNRNALYFKGAKIDSFTIQAQRRGALQETNWLETAIYCFTQSPDQEHLLVGTRGGSESVGEFMVVPAGSVPYHARFEHNNQLEDAVIAEGNEEAGILPEEIQDLRLIGAFRQEMGSVAPSHMFLYVSRL